MGRRLNKRIQKKIKGTELFLTIEDTLAENATYNLALNSCIKDLNEAIAKINNYGGGHSASIITKNNETAQIFMESVVIYEICSDLWNLQALVQNLRNFNPTTTALL